MSFSGKNPEITHCFAYMDSQYTERASARNGGILVRVFLYFGKQLEATTKCVTKFAAMFVEMIFLSRIFWSYAFFAQSALHYHTSNNLAIGKTALLGYTTSLPSQTLSQFKQKIVRIMPYDQTEARPLKDLYYKQYLRGSHANSCGETQLIVFVVPSHICTVY
jgi:hypothetical protein